MTLEEARKVVRSCKGIYSEFDETTVILDGYFSADQLEAIAIVMRAAAEAPHDAREQL